MWYRHGIQNPYAESVNKCNSLEIKAKPSQWKQRRNKARTKMAHQDGKYLIWGFKREKLSKKTCGNGTAAPCARARLTTDCKALIRSHAGNDRIPVDAGIRSGRPVRSVKRIRYALRIENDAPAMQGIAWPAHHMQETRTKILLSPRCRRRQRPAASSEQSEPAQPWASYHFWHGATTSPYGSVPAGRRAHCLPPRPS